MTPLLIITSLLLFTVAAFWRRSWGIAFILAMLPSYLIRFKLVGIPLTLLETYVLILFLAWAVGWWRGHQGWWPAVQALRAGIASEWHWLLFLWVAVSLAAALWSNDPVAGLGVWKAYFLEPGLFAIILFTTIKTDKQLKAAFGFLALGLLIVGSISFFQLLGLAPSPLPWSAQSPARFSSVFEYPNAVGLLAAPIVALTLGCLWRGGLARRERLVAWAAVIAGLVGIAAAVSEGAVLGLAFAAFVGMLTDRRRKYWLTVMVLLVVVIILVPVTRDYLSSRLSFSDTADDVRLRLWTGTWEMLKAHPITGAGLAGFPELYNQYRDAAHVELLMYPHNIVLNFWAELGLAGLCLFIVVVFRFFRGVVRGQKEATGFRRGALFGSALAMVALIGHGLVDVPYFKNDLAVIFWVVVVLGLVASVSGQNQKNEV